MTSVAHIPEEDACHLARNLCVFSRIQKGTPGLTRDEGCILQRVSLGALSDVTVVLGMRQSILSDGCAALHIAYKHGFVNIRDVIKQNESELAYIDF